MGAAAVSCSGETANCVSTYTHLCRYVRDIQCLYRACVCFICLFAALGAQFDFVEDIRILFKLPLKQHHSRLVVSPVSLHCPTGTEYIPIEILRYLLT